MIKIDENYSDYYDMDDEDYPEGKAINASSSESYDGTPILADFVNDVTAGRIAMYEKAYGTRKGISGMPDTQKSSQFADAVEKYVNDAVAAHADERGLSGGAHGATSEAVAGQLITRDRMGCAQVSVPIRAADIANKGYVDGRTKFRVNVTEDVNLDSVATDGIVEISAAESVKVSVGFADAVGLEVSIYNTSAVEHVVEVNNEEFPLSAGADVTLVWTDRWRAECRVPVDDVYIQYGGMKFPQELFPCTEWENISKEYEGEFFRVAGGNSASSITEYNSGGSVYGKTVQGEGLPNITGTVGGEVILANYQSPTGAFYRANYIENGSPAGGNVRADVGFNASMSNKIYGASAHVTPLNSAVQLWQRIS